MQVPKAPSDALRTLEHTATALVAAIMAEQAACGGALPGGPLALSLASSAPTLSARVALPARAVTIAELQRLKRQFVAAHKKAVTLGTTEKGAVGWGAERVAGEFALYIEENLRA